jgi:uncharacterized delta-60 repeat protein
MPLLQTRGAASAQGFGMFSKIGDKYWIGLLNGGTNDLGYGVAVDSTGSVYVCGQSNLGGTNKIQLAKYSPLGVIQWQRSLSPATGSFAIALDTSDNVYITGVRSNFHCQIAKYNSSGTIQWQRSLTSDSGDTTGGQGIATDSSGNVYISGYVKRGAARDIFIAKYDTSGTIQWQRTLESSFSSVNDNGRGVAVDSSGNVYISAYSPPTEFSSEFQAYLIKYDTSGSLQWQRKLHGANQDYAYAVAVDSSSNAYVVGESDNNSSGRFDALIAKYNYSGTIQWQRRLGNSTGDTRAQSIAVDISSNLYICGITSDSGPDQMQIAKYNTSGTIQWQRRLNNATRTRGYSIALFSSNIYVCGELRESSDNDFIIAKLPNDGSLTGTYTVNSISIDYASTSKTDASSTLTAGTASLTNATGSMTDAATTLTDASTSLTSTVTTL